MKYSFLPLFMCLAFVAMAQNQYVIVLHGGAGNGLKREFFDENREQRYHEALKNALLAGKSSLDSGRSGTETVVEVLSLLEDDSLFNAGRGTVLTYDGQVSHDASIMAGADLSAGAISGVNEIRNPIAAAELVRRKSPHVLLSGDGAEKYARLSGLSMSSPEFFETQSSRRALERYKKRFGSFEGGQDSLRKWGTVGCLVLDRDGNLAAGTSTGGMTAKRYGRIGDSPIIGAGTYAANGFCAVSCTGHGEYFIRLAIAYQVYARMRFGGVELAAAVHKVLHEDLQQAGGQGGLIALDQSGEVVMDFNTAGMLRGFLKEGEEPVTRIFE